ncbi:calcium and integrin-binding protein 1-like [Uranotaenia lowii]|uniref:calcium and integrin-binding protein 1-like n=1 Tax=Uranotaenia lowii TaxID=190385 RepID=UPI00247AD257|nr:calcium and integrin-binding protein 1-like [Uranotaenia lowii]
MGAGKSILSSEQLNEYSELTFLSKWEIMLILDKFVNLAPGEDIQQDLQRRFPCQKVMEVFPQLKYNPFRDRLFEVFSSQRDTKYSFEDVLDLFSVMSDNCPHHVKATWAFRVFDFDNDNLITKEDVIMICDRLTSKDQLSIEIKNTVSEVILEEMDLQKNNSLGVFEFVHVLSKIPEFRHSFSFRP